jgi:TolB-like protein
MTVKLIGVLLTCWFGTVGVAPAQTLDQEMAGLADKLNKALAAKGCKNVAALDFTDLQGQPTELGRFLSEQLAVEIVSTGGVSMVDRANLKSILAEHKLTEEGLVNPANAKKLGEFAGVDAILIGNVTALDDAVELMVKGISTSSAQIIAAGRIKFPKTSDLQQLLNRSVSGSAGVAGTSPTTIDVVANANIWFEQAPQVTLRPGKYRISASGSVNSTSNPSDGAFREVGPQGWATRPRFLAGRKLLIDDAPFMCAVAMVSENGSVRTLPITHTVELEIHSSATVRFSVNDAISQGPTSYSDNTGRFVFHISSAPQD